MSAPISAPIITRSSWTRSRGAIPKLRRAISMAIDRDFLAEKVWGGSMFPAYSMVPPGIERLHALRGRLCQPRSDRARRRGGGHSRRARLRTGQSAEAGVPHLRIRTTTRTTPSRSRNSFASSESRRPFSTPTLARTTASWRAVATSISGLAAGSPTTRIPETFLGLGGGRAATIFHTTTARSSSG